MTNKSRTRKAPASKPANTDTEPKQPESMDPAVREQAIPDIPRTNPRDCYAVQTLVAEVTGLFPETAYETSGPNSFNTSLVVAFDDGESPDLFPLLALIQSDVRVLAVDRDSIEHRSVVEFHNNLRTHDSRAPFGLAEAHDILTSGDGQIGLDGNDDFVVENDPEPETEADAFQPPSEPGEVLYDSAETDA